MSPALPSRVEVPADVLVQELDGEAVLLNLENERYYGLDDVGTRMWQLLADNGDVEAAYAQLLAEYDVEADQLRRDMAEWITRLAAAGLLKVPPDSPAHDAA